MKKFTKKFINQKLKIEMSIENIKYNAKKANKKLGIPEKLYLELSKEFPHSKLRQTLDKTNSPTTFMAGFIIGWAEKNYKTK